MGSVLSPPPPPPAPSSSSGLLNASQSQSSEGPTPIRDSRDKNNDL
jgi:hypothetical protein